MNMECCATCKLHMKIETLDYSNGGCEHTDNKGFACLALIHEGWVSHMIGINENNGMCECYQPKEEVVYD